MSTFTGWLEQLKRQSVAFFRNNPLEFVVLILLFLLATFFRFYNIADTAQFLGDQGRDALVMSRMFLERDPVFIGPVTSVGNMYLGPFYYYLMAPFLWLTYPNPIGPAYAVALLSSITTTLLYFWGRELLGQKAALFATALFAFSQPVIEYARFSWNPNVVPFFALALLYASYKAWKKQPRYWILVCLVIGLLIQLHYLTLVLVGGAGAIWLLAFFSAKQKSEKLLHFRYLLLGGVVFFLTLTPLVLFDLKHQGLNARAFLEIFTTEQSFSTGATGVRAVVGFLESGLEQAKRVFLDLSLGVRGTQGMLGILALFVFIGYLLSDKKEKKRHDVVAVLCLYIFIAIIGISFYTHQIFDHYILFFVPLTVLLFGWIFAYLWRFSLFGRLLVVFCLVAYVYSQIKILPLVGTTMTMQEYAVASEVIATHVRENERYAVVLLSGTGDLYGQNYRYFLSTYPNKKPVDSERTIEVDTLVVINEEGLEKPLELPIYQIQIFPTKEVAESFTTPSGVEVFILRKNDTTIQDGIE